MDTPLIRLYEFNDKEGIDKLKSLLIQKYSNLTEDHPYINLSSKKLWNYSPVIFASYTASNFELYQLRNWCDRYLRKHEKRTIAKYVRYLDIRDQYILW